MTLEWNPNPDALDKIIAAYHDADISKRELWPQYCEWMVRTTNRFREVFGPRIRELELEESIEGTDDDDTRDAE